MSKHPAKIRYYCMHCAGPLAYFEARKAFSSKLPAYQVHHAVYCFMYQRSSVASKKPPYGTPVRNIIYMMYDMYYSMDSGMQDVEVNDPEISVSAKIGYHLLNQSNSKLTYFIPGTWQRSISVA